MITPQLSKRPISSLVSLLAGYSIRIDLGRLGRDDDKRLGQSHLTGMSSFHRDTTQRCLEKKRRESGRVTWHTVHSSFFSLCLTWDWNMLFHRLSISIRLLHNELSILTSSTSIFTPKCLRLVLVYTKTVDHVPQWFRLSKQLVIYRESVRRTKTTDADT